MWATFAHKAFVEVISSLALITCNLSTCNPHYLRIRERSRAFYAFKVAIHLLKCENRYVINKSWENFVSLKAAVDLWLPMHSSLMTCDILDSNLFFMIFRVVVQDYSTFKRLEETLNRMETLATPIPTQFLVSAKLPRVFLITADTRKIFSIS